VILDGVPFVPEDVPVRDTLVDSLEGEETA
jgi:hypothetical protein